jgi:hypothetical protein
MKKSDSKKKTRLPADTGGGEPLLQPRLTEWIAQAKAAG